MLQTICHAILFKKLQKLNTIYTKYDQCFEITVFQTSHLMIVIIIKYNAHIVFDL